MSKIDLVSNDWCDLVFEGKNKEYGAYKLRKCTSKRNIFALIVILLATVLLFLGVSIVRMVEAAQKDKYTDAVELSAIAETKKKPEVKKEVVKVEPKKVVEQVKNSIKFTPPVIKKDSEVKPEEELKQQDDLSKTKTDIGAINVTNGSDEGVVMKLDEKIKEPEPVKADPVENKVFDVVEQQPSFPGGPAALNSWLRENIKYPVVAAENGVEGRVTVQFVVERDGSVSGAHVVKSVDPSLDKEALRVVSRMPKWIPGKQNGQSVRVKFFVPVTFRLQ